MNNIPSQWTTEGFMQRYEANLQASSTYMEAYLATEKEHKQEFGSNRYKNYDAFRSTRKSMIGKK